MSIYDYAYRDVWDSNFSDSLVWHACAKFDWDEHVGDAIAFTEKICSKYPNVFCDLFFVRASEENDAELQEVHLELQKHFICSPIMWIPRYNIEDDYETQQKMRRTSGFIVAVWEHIDKEPDEHNVQKFLASIESKQSRIYGDSGDLVDMIAARNVAMSMGYFCGPIISNTDVDSSYTYFMDVYTEPKHPDFADCQTADEVARRLSELYEFEYVEDKHMLMWFKEGYYMSAFEPFPEVLTKARDVLLQFTTVSPICFIEMNSNEECDVLDGYAMYIAFGCTEEDNKYKSIDILDTFTYLD